MTEPAGTSDEHPAPGAQAPPPQSDSGESGPGARLLAERRAQGLSLGDIARQLKLSVRQVEALERDDYGAFAGMVFVRGFLRNYAKLLHLDADALLAGLQPSAAAEENAREGSAAHAAPAPTAASPVRQPGLGWLAGGLVLLVLVVAAIYEGRDKHAPALAPVGTIAAPAGGEAQLGVPPPGAGAPAPRAPGSVAQPAAPPFSAPDAVAARPPEPVQPAASPGSASPVPSDGASLPPAVPAVTEGPVVAAEDAPAASAAATMPSRVAPGGYTGEGEQVFVKLVFEDESWVEIKDATGDVIFSQLNAPGTERVVRGHPPFAVVVGNAHAVRISYRDRPVDLEPHTRVDVARVVLQ